MLFSRSPSKRQQTNQKRAALTLVKFPSPRNNSKKMSFFFFFFKTGGIEDWVVDCLACGTHDDDGERMVSCDHCGRWFHTRCAGVDDDEPVPPLAVCAECGSDDEEEEEE